ncbi:MAG: sulfide-dependent adenosine diphosphate thiazole synthase [Actinomycetota bacterium]|nr:sulfide-dependent adenosine diphosphate thiazole synthase [Actinomycetota bacterium]
MAIEETAITSAIVRSFMEDFLADLELDVAVVGAGPSGITAARYLAEAGVKVAIFERDLYVGGGIWGGGMLFPRIVVQGEAREMLEEVGVRLRPVSPDLYAADAVETASRSAAAALDRGVRIWVGMCVEDVVLREGDRVCGVVLNWMAVERAGLHVDPLAVSSKLVIDATGHDAEISRVISRKVPGLRLLSVNGEVMGERPMWAEKGEEALVDNTRQIHPGLLVAGMAANAVYGSHRMGAIFGGMLMSGRKAARLALELLE